MCNLFCNIVKLFNLVVATCTKTDWIKLRVIYVLSAITSRHLQRPDLLHSNRQGHPPESLRKRPENNNKAWLMLSEAILSILGDCWENLIGSSLSARLMVEFPASKVLLHTPCNLTYWEVPGRHDVCPAITDQFGCGQRAEPFLWQITHSSYTMLHRNF